MENDRSDNKGADSMVCACGEMHKGHICWLSTMGLLQEVKHLTTNPMVACRKCGAKVNMAHNVCFPGSLDEK